MKLRKKAGLLSKEKEEELTREADEMDEAFQIETINGVLLISSLIPVPTKIPTTYC